MQRASALSNAPSPLARGMTKNVALSSKDLKHYPHFDAPLSLKEAKNLVSDEKRVASNGFFPLMLFEKEWQPYRSADVVKPEKKSRPIRYGARRDAYIFSHYRYKLSERYEERLRELGIAECPVAYRQVPRDSGKGGKCNIDFAKDAFDTIDQLGDCVAIGLDISKYFESLDHKKVKEVWCDLLGVDKLPADHYRVFRNITKYRYVEQREVYRRLGYFGEVKRNGRSVEGFTVPYKEMNKQLCSTSDFRAKICGYDPHYTSIIKKNEASYGIPQGAPISDLIANFYLLEFDLQMRNFAAKRSGRYVRYSDDILLILPGNEDVASEARQFVCREIESHGSKLSIKDEKTCVVSFRRGDEGLQYQHLAGRNGKNGFEFLGFRYDGRKVYVRESTMSRLFRKVSVTAKREGTRYAAANPNLSYEDLIDNFNFSRFSQKFLRVKREDLCDDYRSWTFYTYLKRAARTFGAKGDCIPHQARNVKTEMRRRVNAAIESYTRRDGRMSKS